MPSVSELERQGVTPEERAAEIVRYLLPEYMHEAFTPRLADAIRDAVQAERERCVVEALAMRKAVVDCFGQQMPEYLYRFLCERVNDIRGEAPCRA